MPLYPHSMSRTSFSDLNYRIISSLVPWFPIGRGRGYAKNPFQKSRDRITLFCEFASAPSQLFRFCPRTIYLCYGYDRKMRLKLSLLAPFPSIKVLLPVPEHVKTVIHLKRHIRQSLSVVHELTGSSRDVVLEIEGFELLGGSEMDVIENGDVVW